MRKVNPWKLATVALSLALGGVLLTGAGEAQSERQPLMHKALGNLNQALNNLQSATHDKGGHRVKAIGLVKSAIAEVDAGIKADNAR